MNQRQPQQGTAGASLLGRMVSDALSAGDLDRADALLAPRDGALPADAIAPAAELHMRRHRWLDAAALWQRLASHDVQCRLKLHTARNFAELKRHRPRVYDTMLRTQVSTRYRFTGGRNDRLLIADCRNPAQPVVLTPGGDPLAATKQAYERLAPTMKKGAGVGLCGVGDGYLLATLAKAPPKLFMDCQQAVFLFEPDASLLLMCLMLHDYSGADGPIAQPRFQWFVGPRWAEQFREALSSDLLLAPPRAMVQQSVEREAMGDALADVAAAFKADDERRKKQIERYCAAFDLETLLSIIDGGANGDRQTERQPAASATRAPGPPRVLLLTTRFSTVLQYATRDTAEAFRRLGWATRVMIEPTPYHSLPFPAIRQALAEFKPDLVFQIDHLRHEHDDLFPPTLPFVCWIQDHLSNLTDRDAGRNVGRRDFVLTFAAPLFIDTYDYPARQCIDMPMMLTLPSDSHEQDAVGERVRVSGNTTQRSTDGLVYVSNVSHDPSTLPNKIADGLPAEHREFMRVCGQRIVEHYAQGGSLPARPDLWRVYESVRQEMSLPPLESDVAGKLVEKLWNPLNSALFRQQALAWAADAADAMGLSLGVYGLGWEQHPRFAQYARGVVAHGPELAALTQRTPINLNLEPYPCFSHHRLLDGLVAGGFFLVRAHPANTALQDLLNLLERHSGASVQTTADAEAAISDEHRKQLNYLLDRAAAATITDVADPVRQVRCMQRAGVLIEQPSALPRLDEVSFDNCETCHTLIERFINDPDARADIAAQQRRSIENRLTFTAGIRMALRRITALLAEEPETQHDDEDTRRNNSACAA